MGWAQGAPDRITAVRNPSLTGPRDRCVRVCARSPSEHRMPHGTEGVLTAGDLLSLFILLEKTRVVGRERVGQIQTKLFKPISVNYFLF
jgi:hypothetical protein